MQIAEEQQNEIFRRGTEAEAFIHSPLFVDLTKWLEREERLLAVAIALDRRDETQKNLTREQFCEQMAGYYRGVHTYHALFTQYVNDAKMLQKKVDSENAAKEEEIKQKVTMEELKKKAYSNG